jgi:hypothetical protein
VTGMRTSMLGGEVVRGGYFGPMSRPAVAALGASAVLTIALWLGVGGAFSTVAGFVVLGTAFVALYPWDGRRTVAERWLWRARFLHSRVCGLNRFVPAGLVTSGPRHRRWPPPLGQVRPLDLRGTPHEDMFVLYHHNPGEERYLSVVLQLDGQQEEASAGYATMLAHLAKGGFVRGIQQLTRIVPHDPARHRVFIAARAARQPGRQWLVSCYQDLVDRTAVTSEQHRNYVVARIPVTHQFVTEAQRCGAGVAGWAELVREELARMADLVRGAGLSRPRVLGEQRTCAVLRSLQDPDFPIDHHAGVRWWNCWQSYVGEYSHVTVNGKWFSRTAIVPRDAIPAVPLGSRWLAALLTQVDPPVIRTLSVRMEVVPAVAARAATVRDAAMDCPAWAEDTAAQQRLRDLAPGSGHHGVHWSMAISITARDPGGVRRACARIGEAAADCALSRLDWQDSKHDIAAVMTYPLGRGMAVRR